MLWPSLFDSRLVRAADERIRRPPSAVSRSGWANADIQTTMKYLHYESRKEDADLVARAFRTEQVGDAQEA